MGTIQSFTDLICWQKAHRLAIEVYKNTGTFPKEEVYGLTSQCRRAASSISANIAEGFNAPTTREYLRYLDTAKRSAHESENWLYKLRDLHLLNGSAQHHLDSCAEIARMLNGLSRSLANKSR